MDVFQDAARVSRHVSCLDTVLEEMCSNEAQLEAKNCLKTLDIHLTSKRKISKSLNER